MAVAVERKTDAEVLADYLRVMELPEHMNGKPWNILGLGLVRMARAKKPSINSGLDILEWMDEPDDEDDDEPFLEPLEE